MQLNSTEQVLHKTILQSLGDIADLPNTEKQTDTGSKNEDIKKSAINERIEEFSGKRTK